MPNVKPEPVTPYHPTRAEQETVIRFDYVVPLARLRWSVARERVEGAPKRTGNAAALARERKASAE